MFKSRHRHAFTDKLDHLSEDTLNKVDEVVDTFKSQTQKYSKVTEDYIHKYPLRSMGIAMAAGALLVLLLRK